MPRELKKRKFSVGPCSYCKKDETMDMVACDDCDKWFHYHCAGVGREVKYYEWSCYDCKDQKDRKTTQMSQGRHDDCKKKTIPGKINYLSSQSSKSQNIENENKTQLKELSNHLANLKIEIDCKNERIDEQGEKIKELFNHLAVLKIEISSKNEVIDKQRVMIEGQQKQLNELKIEIETKKAHIDKQPQVESVEDVVDVEKEVDALAIFMNLLCDSVEEVNTFNTKLRNAKLVCVLRDQFLIFGGDVKTFITGMVNRILSKELQSKLSWSGKRTTKPGLSDFSNVTDLIHFCCVKKFDKYDTVNGEQIIQKLLQKPT